MLPEKESPPPTPREAYEERQRQWLAPYAVHEAASGGRKHPEDEHPYRTCFHRDRDRVVHSAAFRRLDFKTQVFVPHEHDHYRTRLTHTLEVAQIARALGRALRLNEDLIEAAALAHDLGHPPFGHAGEAVLDDLMAAHGHFEHNRQSLRVVDYLEHPYPLWRGLNLTRAVRECIALHRTRYDTPICDDFDASLQPPLEGQIVDVADEIAYTSADLEDALAAGWITMAQVAPLALWQSAWATAQRETPEARPIHKRIRACKAVLAALADDLLATTAAELRGSGCHALTRPRGRACRESTCPSSKTRKGMAPGVKEETEEETRGQAQRAPAGDAHGTQGQDALATALATPGAVRRAGRRLAVFSAPTADALKATQDFLLREVYLSPRAVEKDRQARLAVTGLFQAYVADPALLPDRYRSRIDSDGLHRTVCDYIAGMTDRFCLGAFHDLRAGRRGEAPGDE